MKDIVIINESSGSYKKKYKCPYCDKRYERQKLISHIDRNHEELIPEDYTATRVVYNMINHREYGSCMMCHNKTEWDDNKNRYNSFCSEECKEAYVKMCRERNMNKYGKENLLDDPEQQIKMLQNRRISGYYKFTSGGKVPYVGSYERKFLEFIDVFLHIKTREIIPDYPLIKYEYDGKLHTFIPDFYYIPYNLVLDIKDGGSNPNTRTMEEYRAKQEAKESAITEQNEYNYMRLTDNNFQQLISLFMYLKELSLDDEDFKNGKKHISRIHEDVSTIGPMIGIDTNTTMQRYPDRVYMVYLNKDNLFSKIGVCKDKTLNNTIFSNDKYNLEIKKLNYLDKSNFKVFEYKDPSAGYKYYKLLEWASIGDKIVTDKDIYTLFTGKDLLDYNQLLYDDCLKETTCYIDELKILESTVISTLISDDDLIIPMVENVDEDCIKYGLDLNGYFVYNETTGYRSKSYDNKKDIPKEVLKIL